MRERYDAIIIGAATAFELARPEARLPDPERGQAPGRRVQVPFRLKGQWMVRSNNPRRRDGVVHQYCPPERVQDEMDCSTSP